MKSKRRDDKEESKHKQKRAKVTVEREADCPVCWEPFSVRQRPAVLIPCGHSICEYCMIGGKLVQCCVCREQILYASSTVINWTLLQLVGDENERLSVERRNQEERDGKAWPNKVAAAALSRHYPFDPDRLLRGDKKVVGLIEDLSDPDKKVTSLIKDLSGPDNLVVRRLDGRKRGYNMDFQATTVYALKRYLSEEAGLKPEQVRLIFRGQPMSDDYTLAKHGVERGQCVHMILQMRGDIGRWSTGPLPVFFKDKEQARLVIRRVYQEGGRPLPDLKTLKKWPYQTANPLSAEQCRVLIQGAFPPSEEMDWQLDLSRERLESLIGIEAVARLFRVFGARVDVIRLRRVRPTGDQVIPFHLDESRQTMQIVLNSMDSFDGGQVVYVTEQDGFVAPKKSTGEPYFHDNTVVHGVTCLTRGERCSLFFLSY